MSTEPVSALSERSTDRRDPSPSGTHRQSITMNVYDDEENEPWDEQQQQQQRTMGDRKSQLLACVSGADLIVREKMQCEYYGNEGATVPVEPQLEDGDLPPLSLKKQQQSRNQATMGGRLVNGQRTTTRPLNPPSQAGLQTSEEREARLASARSHSLWDRLDFMAPESSVAADQRDLQDEDLPDDELEARRSYKRREVDNVAQQSDEEEATVDDEYESLPRSSRRRAPMASLGEIAGSASNEDHNGDGFCDALSSLGEFCGGGGGGGDNGGESAETEPESQRPVTSKKLFLSPKPRDYGVEEHTAIEVEYVDPNADDVDTEEEEIVTKPTANSSSWSPGRKNAYLAAMARRAREDYENSATGNKSIKHSKRAVERSKSEGPPVPSKSEFSTNDDVYNSFNATEKRKFLKLINSGLSPSQGSRKIIEDRQDKDKTGKDTGKDGGKGPRFPFWKKNSKRSRSVPTGSRHGDVSLPSTVDEEEKKAEEDDDEKSADDSPSLEAPWTPNPPSLSKHPISPVSSTPPVLSPLNGKPDPNFQKSPKSPKSTRLPSVQLSRHAGGVPRSSLDLPTLAPNTIPEAEERKRSSSKSPGRSKFQVVPVISMNDSSDEQDEPPVVAISSGDSSHAPSDVRSQFARSGINYYDAVRKERPEEDESDEAIRGVTPTRSSSRGKSRSRRSRRSNPRAQGFSSLDSEVPKAETGRRGRRRSRSRSTTKSPETRQRRNVLGIRLPQRHERSGSKSRQRQRNGSEERSEAEASLQNRAQAPIVTPTAEDNPMENKAAIEVNGSKPDGLYSKAGIFTGNDPYTPPVIEGNSSIPSSGSSELDRVIVGVVEDHSGRSTSDSDQLATDSKRRRPRSLPRFGNRLSRRDTAIRKPGPIGATSITKAVSDRHIASIPTSSAQSSAIPHSPSGTHIVTPDYAAYDTPEDLPKEGRYLLKPSSVDQESKSSHRAFISPVTSEERGKLSSSRSNSSNDIKDVTPAASDFPKKPLVNGLSQPIHDSVPSTADDVMFAKDSQYQPQEKQSPPSLPFGGEGLSSTAEIATKPHDADTGVSQTQTVSKPSTADEDAVRKDAKEIVAENLAPLSTRNVEERQDLVAVVARMSRGSEESSSREVSPPPSAKSTTESDSTLEDVEGESRMEHDPSQTNGLSGSVFGKNIDLDQDGDKAEEAERIVREILRPGPTVKREHSSSPYEVSPKAVDRKSPISTDGTTHSKSGGEEFDVDLETYLDSTELLSAAGGYDVMSIVSGRSGWTNRTGLSGSSTITQSSRKRRPGAAKGRLAKAKEADAASRKKGWHETIRAVAKKSNRVWDPKAGWVDYYDPSPETQDVKSDEKIRICLDGVSVRSRDSNSQNKETEASESEKPPTVVPFPKEWEKQRIEMVQDVLSLDSGTATLESDEHDFSMSNVSSTPKRRSRRAKREEQRRALSATRSRPSGWVETMQLASANIGDESRGWDPENGWMGVEDPVVAGSSLDARDVVSLDSGTAKLESDEHDVNLSTVSSTPKRRSSRAKREEPRRALSASPSRPSGWVETMHLATANIGDESRGWDPENGWMGIEDPVAAGSSPDARDIAYTESAQHTEMADYSVPVNQEAGLHDTQNNAESHQYDTDQAEASNALRPQHDISVADDHGASLTGRVAPHISREEQRRTRGDKAPSGARDDVYSPLPPREGLLSGHKKVSEKVARGTVMNLRARIGAEHAGALEGGYKQEPLANAESSLGEKPKIEEKKKDSSALNKWIEKSGKPLDPRSGQSMESSEKAVASSSTGAEKYMQLGDNGSVRSLAQDIPAGPVKGDVKSQAPQAPQAAIRGEQQGEAVDDSDDTAPVLDATGGFPASSDVATATVEVVKEKMGEDDINLFLKASRSKPAVEGKKQNSSKRRGTGPIDLDEVDDMSSSEDEGEVIIDESDSFLQDYRESSLMTEDPLLSMEMDKSHDLSEAGIGVSAIGATSGFLLASQPEAKQPQPHKQDFEKIMLHQAKSLGPDTLTPALHATAPMSQPVPKLSRNKRDTSPISVRRFSRSTASSGGGAHSVGTPEPSVSGASSSLYSGSPPGIKVAAPAPLVWGEMPYSRKVVARADAESLTWTSDSFLHAGSVSPAPPNSNAADLVEFSKGEIGVDKIAENADEGAVPAKSSKPTEEESDTQKAISASRLSTKQASSHVSKSVEGTTMGVATDPGRPDGSRSPDDARPHRSENSHIEDGKPQNTALHQDVAPEHETQGIESPITGPSAGLSADNYHLSETLLRRNGLSHSAVKAHSSLENDVKTDVSASTSVASSVRLRRQQWESRAAKAMAEDEPLKHMQKATSKARPAVKHVEWPEAKDDAESSTVTAEWKSFLGKKVRAESAAAAKQQENKGGPVENQHAPTPRNASAPLENGPHDTTREDVSEREQGSNSVLPKGVQRTAEDENDFGEWDGIDLHEQRVEGGKDAVFMSASGTGSIFKLGDKPSQVDGDSVFDFPESDAAGPKSQGNLAKSRDAVSQLPKGSMVEEKNTSHKSTDQPKPSYASPKSTDPPKPSPSYDVSDDTSTQSDDFSESEFRNSSEGAPVKYSFFKRLTACAAPILSGSSQNGDSFSQQLASFRSTYEGHKFAPPILCGRPDPIIEDQDDMVEEIVNFGARSSQRRSRRTSPKSDKKPVGSEVWASSSAISEDFGAKTAYLEAIAMKAAVSNPKRGDSRKRSPGSDLTQDSKASHSERWQKFLERKASGASRGKPKKTNSVSDVSKAAERYAAEKVEEMMAMMASRPKSAPTTGKTSVRSNNNDGDRIRALMDNSSTSESSPSTFGSKQRRQEIDKLKSRLISKQRKSETAKAAEDLAAARVEAMMAALSSGTLDEGEI